MSRSLIDRLRAAEEGEERAYFGDVSLLFKEAREEIEQYESVFQLSWRASQRAIDAWRSANPGNERRWPDAERLQIWLMDEVERLQRTLAAHEVPAGELTAYPLEQEIRPGQWFRPGMMGQEEERKFNAILHQISDALKPHGMELCNDADGNYSVQDLK